MKKLTFFVLFCLVSSLAICYPFDVKIANGFQSKLDNPGKHRPHGRTRKSRRGDRVVRTYHQPYAKIFRVSNRVSSILK